MKNFEQDFYKFVKEQLAKKQKLKEVSPTNSKIDETEEMERNRLFNENVSKVLQQERKKMKINKVTREQLFNRKFKDFTNMDTFVDIKQFLKQLSQQKLAKEEIKKKMKTLKKLDSDSDDDIFDYAEIIQKSKNIVQKSNIIRHKPNIQGYLISESELVSPQNSIEELKSEDDKFYYNVDQLIQDIKIKDEQKELQQKYDEQRKNFRKSIQLNISKTKNAQKNDKEDESKQKQDELIAQQAKQFKQQTEKVLVLLQKTTKQLFNNKHMKKGEKQFYQQKKLTEPIIQLSEISEQRSTFHQYIPQTTRSTTKLPQISPNNSIIYSHRTYNSQDGIHEILRKITPIHIKIESREKMRNQFKQFIQKIDRAKASFDKSNRKDQQLLSIQQRIIKNMNKIGEIPLESLKILNKKEFEISNFKISNLRKARPMQII